MNKYDNLLLPAELLREVPTFRLLDWQRKGTVEQRLEARRELSRRYPEGTQA